MASPQLNSKMLMEIARLSMIIFEGVPRTESQGLAMLINHLTAVIMGQLSISSFHDQIVDTPKVTREYYYKLLYEEK